MKTKHLVVDTAAFVKNVPLWEYGEKFYSVTEIIGELRDRATRQRFEALPVTITMREPQPWAIRFVNQFSKKTGDYASLSLADVKILALTYELEIEARGSSDHLRSEPQKCVIEGPTSKPQSEDQQNIEGFHLPADKEETSKLPDLIGQKTPLLDNALQVDMSALTVAEVDESKEKECKGDENKRELNLDDNGSRENGSVESSDGYTEESDVEENGFVEEDGCFEYENNCDELENVDSYQDFTRNEDDDEGNEDEDDNGDDEDDDEGWITPSNIKRHKLKNKAAPEDEDEDEGEVLVACISSDFAIQNMLKHIGLSVMGVDGKIIRQIRTFILRCYACFKTCSDVSKIFCPKCGNKTLKRVSVTVNPDGTQKIWINFKKPINTKGMRFTLPRPRGGQHARNPILVADQREVRQMASKMSKKKINPLHEDYDPDNSPFAVRDVYSRAAQLGYSGDKCHNHFYWERKNPNARVGRSKKKK